MYTDKIFANKPEFLKKKSSQKELNSLKIIL